MIWNNADFETLSESTKILLVEDDPGQRELVAFNLEREGWAIRQAEDGKIALAMTKEWQPDLIVLGWDLKDICGLDVYHCLKNKLDFSPVPINMLCTLDEHLEQLRRLELVSDQYLQKPYLIIDLVSRICACLRRFRPTATEQVLSFDEIILDSGSYRVRFRGELVHLSPIDFHLLATLMENRGKIWSRRSLIDKVWGLNTKTDGRTVDAHIVRLRKALGQSNKEYPIRTIRGKGYKVG